MLSPEIGIIYFLKFPYNRAIASIECISIRSLENVEGFGVRIRQ
ncbi:MAG: hypothetical protein V7K25_00830 [Nostoc sp.]